MSVEENKTIARRYTQMFNTGNLDDADKLFAPNFTLRHLDAPTPELDREGWKKLSRPFISGFSERRLEVEDLVTEGDQVVARVTFFGRHTGNFQGILPTNRQVECTGMIWFRIAEGKSVEHWGEFVALGLMQQLGVIPLAGQGLREPDTPGTGAGHRDL